MTNRIASYSVSEIDDLYKRVAALEAALDRLPAPGEVESNREIAARMGIDHEYGPIVGLRLKLTKAEQRVAELENTFRHTHVADHQAGDDRCESCGLDLRDRVHHPLEPDRP